MTGIYSRLWPHLRRQRGRILLGLVCLAVFVGVSLVRPRLLRIAVEEIEREGVNADLAWIVALAGAFLAANAVSGAFGFLRRLLMIGASRRAEATMRDELYGHLTRQSHRYFDHAATGDLMSRLTADIEAVRQSFGPGIMYISDTIFRAPATLVLMALIDVRLMLLALAPLLALTVVVKLLSPSVHRYSRQVQEEEASLRARSQESFAGVRIVKSYGQEENEIRDYSAVADRYLEASMGLAKTRAIMRPSIMGLAGLGPVLVLLVGGVSVAKGDLSFGAFLEFTAYYGMLVWPMMAIGWVLTLVQRGAAAMRRVNEILDREPEIRDALDLVDIDRIGGDIEFRNLTFAYAGAGAALTDVDLRVEQGRTVAVVGPTGCGKSTLVSLVPRLYDPPPETLFIDGIPVERLPLGLLRRSIATVPQETFLFSDTIRANIAYGVEGDVTEEEILEAAAISRIDEDVREFPDGYDTMLGERGVNLSGGQKQRVALARAILLKAPILILDDALSAVDTHTEEQILRRLRGVMAGRTTLLISHRVSTVKEADLIVVLDEGRIVERGTHDRLVAADGVYATMHRLQLLEEELEAIE